MSHVSLILSILFACLLLIWMAPGTLALNRGNILRNVALWLAIFVGLALIYRNFGPGSPHPLLGPASMQPTPYPDDNETGSPSAKTDGKHEDRDDGSQGYTPPKE